MNTVLFDLDGTLLPMDQDLFVSTYFKRLAQKVAPLGYEPKALIGGIWAGTAAMVKNDGSKRNEEVFWDCFAKLFGQQVYEHVPVFEEFYRVEFQEAQKVCGFHPMAKEVVRWIKDNGFRVALATNPLFPSVATESRIRWAGLEPEDFEWFTTYENTSFCKPNPEYYRVVTEHLGVDPRECIMVGNDVAEDMIARKLGMKVFLLTDCMINKQNEDISAYPHGGFPELLEYLKENLSK